MVGEAARQHHHHGGDGPQAEELQGHHGGAHQPRGACPETGVSIVPETL